MSIRLPILGSAALLLLALVLATGAGSRAAGPSVTPVGSAACGAVQYGGPGAAQALIVSDLPLQGDSRERSLQMNDAIRLVLEGAGWHAGGLAVAFQACDDSDAKTGLWSKSRCQANARAYAADPSVLGVVGTYNSGCAEAIVPILGRAPGGGLAMVSPGNTAICLTQRSPSCSGGEPGSLYPKRHNYARVVPNDAYQGAGLASFAKQRGIKRAYVLYAGKDPTSLGQAKTFRGAAGKLGIALAGFSAWNTGASSYSGLMRKVAATSPDAVLLAGLTEQNGGRLIKDKVATMGPNQRQGEAARARRLRPAIDDRAVRHGGEGHVRQRSGTGAAEPRRTGQEARRRTAEGGQRPGRTVCALRRPGGERVARRDLARRGTRRGDRWRPQRQGPERHRR
ncbi:MAG TPA: ABC transporter substrate-binding protein [Solirubrobacterales bacterium]